MILLGRLLLPVLFLAAPASSRSLTVEQAVAVALENDLGVQAAKAEERKARAQATQSLLALFPSLSASAGYTRLGEIPYVEFDMSEMYGTSDYSSSCDDISEDDLPSGWTVEVATDICDMIMGWMTAGSSSSDVITIEMGLADNYFAGFTLEQILFAGGALHQVRRANKSFLVASQENLRLARQQAAYSAEQLFYGLVMAREAREVTRQATETADAYVSLLQDMVDQGMADRSDLLAAQAQASQSRLDAMKAAHGARLAEATFKITLGIPDDEDLDLVMPGGFYDQLPAERERLLDLARRQRPELGQLDATLQGMGHMARASWASWLPSLALQANLTWRNPNYSLEQEWYRSTDLTLAASWALWDRGKGLMDHQAAVASWSALHAQREQLYRMLKVEVQSALASLDESMAEVEVARTGVRQAQEALRLEQDRFQQGMANNTDLLAAQAAVSGARLALLQAQTGTWLAHAALRKAVGDEPEVTP